MKKSHLILALPLFLGLLLSNLHAQATAIPRGGSFGDSLGDGKSLTFGDDEDNTVVPAIDEGNYDEGTHKDCDGANHEHTHTNTTDDKKNDVYDIIHATAIVFDDEMWNNLDTTTLICSDAESTDSDGDGDYDDETGTYVDCGFSKTSPNGTTIYSAPGGKWGGVKIKYYTNLNWIEGSPRGLVWEYGTDDPSDITLLPWATHGQSITEGISFDLTDYTTAHTVSTTSWTKEEFYSIKKTDDHGKWDNYTHVYTDQAEPYKDEVDPDGDYIYWYGLNGTAVSHFDACAVPEEKITCTSLEISPTTGDLGVGDVFSDVPFTVTATGTDSTGARVDITKDSTFQYYVNKFGSADTAGDAGGFLRFSTIWPFTSTSKSPNTKDNTVTFEDTDPGDSLYVYVSDYNGKSYEKECSTKVEFPYCTDLSIDQPHGAFGSPFWGWFIDDHVSPDVEVSAEANTREAWPYSITYSSTDTTSTFTDDGGSTHGTPYTTTDYSLHYDSDNKAQVDVALDDHDGDGVSDDVAGTCNDNFFYLLKAPEEEKTCKELVIDQTGPISAEEMEAGNVEISWESIMDDGTPTPGSVTCESSNPSGSFVDASGKTGTGSISTTDTRVYYTGEPGDAITCTSDDYPVCTDSITSETKPGEEYTCTDVTLSQPYYYDGAKKVYLDETDPASIAALYDSNNVCYDWSLSVSDPAFIDDLVATGYTDSTKTTQTVSNLELTAGFSGKSWVGNPAHLTLTGHTTYGGTLCWQDFEAGNVVTLETKDHSVEACYEEDTIPALPPAEELACTGLEMTPDSVVISSSATDAGTVNVSITVTGSDAAWSGTLVIMHTGKGSLYYPDGSPSEYSDGQLSIPVSGLSTTVNVTYVGGKDGDAVTAFITGEVLEGICVDALHLSQETEEHHEEEHHEGSSGGDSGSSGSSEEVCKDVSFEDSGEDLVCGDDYETTICLDTENSSEDIVISREDEGEEICYYDEGDDEWVCEDGEITVENVKDGECIDVKAKNVCEEEIRAEVKGEVCEDSVTPESPERLGTFNKYIYTFNFSAEKNSYSDEGVFFAHDEDRAFYTLEYSPTGSETEITFTDDMWDAGQIDATNGDGGHVDLATDYGELTGGTGYNSDSRYTYSTITHMGFGTNSQTHELLEENSTDVANYVDSLGTAVPSFIAYKKYESGESKVILACAYDDDGKVEQTDPCYDPTYSPADATDPKVVIENAGAAESEGAVIRIRYVGVIHSNLNCKASQECLTEEFDNKAQVSAGGTSLEDSARLVVLCSYLLTENGGDVYLNENFTGGSNLACVYNDSQSYAGYSNVDGLVIINPDSTSDTDSGDDSSDIPGGVTDATDSTISFCDNTSSTSLLGNLSSYVCEIVNSVSDLWKTTTVESTTESRVSQATRNAVTEQTGTSMSFTKGTVDSNWTDMQTALSNQNNLSSNILYFKGDSSTGGTLTLGSLRVPCGAWTLIVENADLILKDEITYADSCKDGSSYSTNLPSVAFVVLGGDIHVQNTARSLVGVFYTNQSFEGDTNGSTRSPVDQQLTVDGSLYGNIQPLLYAARYVAPPTTEGGGLVVRYDSRILLNTPPSLSEYVDVGTEKGIN